MQISDKLKTLSLFSGIGGLEKGLEGFIDTKIFCDKDDFCQKILLEKFPDSIIEKDLSTIENYEGDAFDFELIMGGFPCQDISNAGNGKGLDGERSGLVWKMLNIINKFMPNYVFIENVSNLQNKGLQDILDKLDSIGYDYRWCTMEAMYVGALHRRNRLFILGKNRNKECYFVPNFSFYKWASWNQEPNVQRYVDNKDKIITKKITSLGNAVVPDQARMAFIKLLNHNIVNFEENNELTIDEIWNKGFSFVSGSKYLGKTINIEFPTTIQRFKETHTLPTPTASDHILRKPTNVKLSRAFRPGVNKSVSLNRYIEMFPSSASSIPEIDDDGYLITPINSGLIPNPEWVLWLMGFPKNWI